MAKFTTGLKIGTKSAATSYVVVVKGECFQWKNEKGGVPQGSVKGQLLFLTYK